MAVPVLDDPLTGTCGPECHSAGIRGYGNPDSKIVLIGIAPGQHEMLKGRPMVGPSGELINSTLSMVGVNPDLPYRTNCICTWNNTPTPEELLACRPRLQQELDWINPRIVLCLGAIVQKELGLGKRGQLYPRQNKDGTWAWWMWTYHPSAVLQGNYPLYYEITRDFRKLPRLLDLPCPFPRPDRRIITNTQEAQEVLDTYATTTDRVALDIETFLHDPNTDDLDVYTDRLRCLSVWNGQGPVYVFARESLDGLRWPEFDLTTHNGTYDTTGLEQYLGVRLTVRRDTMLKSIATDEYNGSVEHKRVGLHKLENLVGEFYGDTDYKQETKGYWRNKQEPPDTALYARNALDTYYTWHLDHDLEAWEPEPAYERLLLPGANVFSEILQYGVYIDRQAQQALIDEWGPRYIELTVKIQEKVKNPRSWKQVSHYLYASEEEGGLGLEGGPSTRKEIIREFGHPFTQALVEVKELRYRLTNWVFGINEHIKPDGRVHPSVWFGLETGRRAYHNPAVQTIPRWSTDLQKVRRLFAAPDDDWGIMEADLSQAEMWCAAHLSGDKSLLHDLTTILPGKDKADVHASTAHRIGGTRQLGKRANFLMLYGGGGRKLQQTMETFEQVRMSLDDCMDVVNTWRHSYATFAAWADEQVARADKDGYVSTPFGYYRRFPLLLDPSWRSSIVNFPIQSTAGSYTLDSIIQLHPLLRAFDSHILFDIHDSIVIQYRRKYQQEVAQLVTQVMEAPRINLPLAPYTLPGIPCDVKAGHDLAFMEGEMYTI